MRRRNQIVTFTRKAASPFAAGRATRGCLHGIGRRGCAALHHPAPLIMVHGAIRTRGQRGADLGEYASWLIRDILPLAPSPASAIVSRLPGA
jgi:hypothetical protein